MEIIYKISNKKGIVGISVKNEDGCETEVDVISLIKEIRKAYLKSLKRTKRRCDRVLVFDDATIIHDLREKDIATANNAIEICKFHPKGHSKASIESIRYAYSAEFIEDVLFDFLTKDINKLKRIKEINSDFFDVISL